ncbi:unnamed protein product [Fusarium graminearum]|uniref:Uncharacterized protein n=1 Tax=Gibberella zeae TaxID=5518 RepID=A0A2H3H8U0_GIBZA|nr:hypothetical protein FG05_02914 [Fusarium graminearum]KAI6771693.1 hypothetical protein HG531_009318 [Fusarium graminearum]PCD34523.1 hypothetical protein FGRA07_08841 [Fusarium graminearum]CAF3457032.1 unnamed protein product [Fusarium graminearum]CAF3472710.1 unnamed protein product [Fusarium graminearum]
MMNKASLLALALAAVRVQAQEFTNMDLYSEETCNPDPNDLDVQSFQLGVNTQTDDKGNEYSGCNSATIVPQGWPTNANGKYPVWIDTAKFGEGCSMLFFNLPGSQEEGDIWPCRNGLYRKIQKDKTPCGDLELTQKFGYAYCCGSLCNDDVSTWPSKRSLTERAPPAPKAKDVAKLKRAPILKKRQGNDKCIINLKSELYTTFGRQIQVGPEETCEPDQTTCGQTWTYTAGNEITTSESHTDTTEIGFSEYLVFVNSFSDGYEISKSESEERSVSKSMAPEPGHAGYPTFTPLLYCAEADLSGDCSREDLGIGGGEVCVQKYLPGDVPDGTWQMVTTD